MRVFRESFNRFLQSVRGRGGLKTPKGRPPVRGSILTVALATAVALGGGLIVALDGAEADSPYRAFTATSYWNTPLPVDAPVSRRSQKILAFIMRKATTPYVHLAGANDSGQWGNPIYWAKSDDPTYNVGNSCVFDRPPEFASIRIPRGAKPDPSSDSGMTIYDLDKSIVYGLHKARYNDSKDKWRACGGSVYYLASNGLDGGLRRSDEKRNQGHRGVPPSTFAVRYEEVQDGAIEHVLKVAVPLTKCKHVFPMVNDECGTRKKNAPPEGARIRINPSVDLSSINLSPEALTVAKTLQKYGAVIGDQSGGPISLKLENTVAEGRGQLWAGTLTSNALAEIPLSSFEVVRLGYDPTRTG